MEAQPIFTWLHLGKTLYHILSTSHSGVCIALVFCLRFFLWHPWGQPSVNRGCEWVDQCPGSHTPGEGAEADNSFWRSSEVAYSSGNPHFPSLPLCLIVCIVSPVVLGFISQTNSLHPNLCLTTFFGGTQTKIVIYYGQQISSTWATFPLQSS